MWRKRENKKHVHVSSQVCSLFNFQTAHEMVLVMLRLGGCVQGRGVTPLPAVQQKLEGGCLGGWGEGKKTKTHNQHFSLFVSKSHNSHPLSLQLQQLFSCSSSVVSLLWGDGGRAQKKTVWHFPKTCFILHPIVRCWCQWSALSTYVLSLVLIAPSCHT